MQITNRLFQNLGQIINVREDWTYSHDSLLLMI